MVASQEEEEEDVTQPPPSIQLDWIIALPILVCFVLALFALLGYISYVYSRSGSQRSFVETLTGQMIHRSDLAHPPSPSSVPSHSFQTHRSDDRCAAQPCEIFAHPREAGETVRLTAIGRRRNDFPDISCFSSRQYQPVLHPLHQGLHWQHGNSSPGTLLLEIYREPSRANVMLLFRSLPVASAVQAPRPANGPPKAARSTVVLPLPSHSRTSWLGQRWFASPAKLSPPLSTPPAPPSTPPSRRPPPPSPPPPSTPPNPCPAPLAIATAPAASPPSPRPVGVASALSPSDPADSHPRLPPPPSELPQIDPSSRRTQEANSSTVFSPQGRPPFSRPSPTALCTRKGPRLICSQAEQREHKLQREKRARQLQNGHEAAEEQTATYSVATTSVTATSTRCHTHRIQSPRPSQVASQRDFLYRFLLSLHLRWAFICTVRSRNPDEKKSMDQLLPP